MALVSWEASVTKMDPGVLTRAAYRQTVGSKTRFPAIVILGATGKA